MRVMRTSRLSQALVNGNFEVVKAIIEGGFPVNGLVPVNHRHDTMPPLHMACVHGHDEIARWLLSQGADPSIPREKDEATALNLAVRACTEPTGQSMINTVEAMISLGVDLNNPRTPALLDLFWEGRVVDLFGEVKGDGLEPIFDLLIRNGADPTFATNVRTSEMLKAVLVHFPDGYDFDKLSDANGTILHQAARSGLTEICEMMIKRGFDTNAKNEAGQTPAALAREAGHHELAEIISPVAGPKP